ncbi:uncharacterized protein [Argopecten irradians]|uniref:uncharacterized protein n=1 Tax=Argopecten irradians TaxID=31199 RepID=UPI003722E707
MAAPMEIDTSPHSLSDFKALTVKQLRSWLKNENASIEGNKSSLVSRSFALFTSKSACEVKPKGNSSGTVSVQGDVIGSTFADLMVYAGDVEWRNDLRTLSNTNFHQIYEYLVVQTKKYGNTTMKGTAYKKERAYGFFKEGHVNDVKVAHRTDGMVFVRAKVVASMRKLRYSVITVFNANGDVKYAACDCPVGIGIGAEGKCNHAGGLLFYIEDLYFKAKPVGCA